jgi:imidazolonepropionase-like amidohydrolase
MNRTLIRVVLAVLPCVSLPGQETPVVLKGASVFTGSGEFQEGLTIVLSGGKVTAIGKDVVEPAGATVLDLAGQFVTPGLVDANTALGLPQAHENEESAEVTPQIRILDAIDPASPQFAQVLRDGVTTAYVSPGGRNVLGGLGVVLKTLGKDLEARVVRNDADLRMTLGNMPAAGNSPFRGLGAGANMFFRRPTNRMGVIWEVRRAFYDAMDARETRPGPLAEPDAGTRVLIDALDKKIAVRTTARHDQDIRTALRLAEEFGLRIVLDEAVESWQALDYIVAAKVPVVAAPPSLPRADDSAKPHLDTLALLARAGVPVAIATGPGASGLRALPLVREAAFAVGGGMPREAALAAVTSVPAMILGIGDRVGSLAPGRDADVVVWSRHPLSLGSRVARVFVDGVAADPAKSIP